ncbi:unnamed protein product, partial [Effrenium voratum]
MPPQKRKSEQDCAAPSEAEQLAAFRRCAPADEDKARSLLPQVVSTMELLSNTQCVDWSWLLLAAAAGVPQLSPRDRLQLCESILIPGSIWACLIHPGATNTSGIIKMVTKAWELIYARRNAVEEAAALAEARAQMASQEGGDAPAKVVAPPKRKGLAGGGSLAAAGFAASQTQNRGAMFAVEPEVHGIISWLAQESAIDKAVPGKLWDHVTWDRPVMSSGKGFCVQEPFFSFVAGGHIPELVEALESDWFGLRQRLTVLFAPPTWLRLRDIKAACHKLPPETGFKPEVCLSARLYPLFHWSLDRDRALALEGKPPGDLYEAASDDGAQDLVDQKFDFRVEKQRSCFLVPGQQEEAKHHGKMRTKYDRMVLAVHYLNHLCTHFVDMQAAGVGMLDPEYARKFALPQKVPKSTVQFAYWFADHCEEVFAKLDLRRQMPDADVDASQHSPGPVQPGTPPLRDVHPDAAASRAPKVARRAVTLLDTAERLTTAGGLSFNREFADVVEKAPVAEWCALLQTEGSQLSLDTLLAIAGQVLRSNSAWFSFTGSRQARDKVFDTVKQNGGKGAGAAFFAALAASALLASVYLGKLVHT